MPGGSRVAVGRETGMGVGIDPKVDLAFKKVFASADNVSLLIDLLHAVVQPKRAITSLEIVLPHSEKASPADKLAIADVKEGAAYGYAPTTTAAVATANPGVAYGPYSNYASRDNVLTGWTVGAGAEWALNRQVSIGAEYRHADYGHSTYDFGSGAPDTTSEAARIGFTDDQVLAKVNFRFGPGMF